MTHKLSVVVERFAPSPTGRLHLGHAYSAFVAFRSAKKVAGRFVLRVDDLDLDRTQQEFINGVFEDMRWLSLTWDGDTYFASKHKKSQVAALERLSDLGVIYGCRCSRSDIQAVVSAPQEGAGRPVLYPGTCREKEVSHVDGKMALRLDMKRSIEVLGGPLAVGQLSFTELGEGPSGETGMIAINARKLLTEVGDVVLQRKDGSIAYHLAVVVDDANQGVTCATRARDLFSSTPLHRILQALLGVRVPNYRHHRIIRDDYGRRLAKRDGDRSIASFRDAGLAPKDIWAMLNC